MKTKKNPLANLTIEQLLAHFEKAILHGIEVPKSNGNSSVVRWVKYADGTRRAAPKYVSLAKLLKINKVKPAVDPRSVSVKFDENRNIKESNNARLSILNQYRDCVDNGQDIKYVENDDKLYRNQMAFFEAMPDDMLNELIENEEVDLS